MHGSSIRISGFAGRESCAERSEDESPRTCSNVMQNCSKFRPWHCSRPPEMSRCLSLQQYESGEASCHNKQASICRTQHNKPACLNHATSGRCCCQGPLLGLSPPRVTRGSRLCHCGAQPQESFPSGEREHRGSCGHYGQAWKGPTALSHPAGQNTSCGPSRCSRGLESVVLLMPVMSAHEESEGFGEHV